MLETENEQACFDMAFISLNLEDYDKFVKEFGAALHDFFFGIPIPATIEQKGYHNGRD